MRRSACGWSSRPRRRRRVNPMGPSTCYAMGPSTCCAMGPYVLRAEYQYAYSRGPPVNIIRVCMTKTPRSAWICVFYSHIRPMNRKYIRVFSSLDERIILVSHSQHVRRDLGHRACSPVLISLNAIQTAYNSQRSRERCHALPRGI